MELPSPAQNQAGKLWIYKYLKICIHEQIAIQANSFCFSITLLIMGRRSGIQVIGVVIITTGYFLRRIDSFTYKFKIYNGNLFKKTL